MSAGNVVCAWDGCTDTFANTHDMKNHHAHAHGESIAGVSVECEWCGEELFRSNGRIERSKNQFCDSNCLGKYKEQITGEDHPLYNSIVIECEWCGEKVEKWPSHAEKNEKAFCSRECQAEWKSENTQGENSPTWQEVVVTNTIQAVRESYSEDAWSSVAERKKNEVGECERCGKRHNLHVHHIIPVRTGGTNDQYNLMVLCASCHRSVESYTAQFTESHLTKFVSAG